MKNCKPIRSGTKRGAKLPLTGLLVNFVEGRQLLTSQVITLRQIVQAFQLKHIEESLSREVLQSARLGLAAFDSQQLAADQLAQNIPTRFASLTGNLFAGLRLIVSYKRQDLDRRRGKASGTNPSVETVSDGRKLISQY